MLVNEYEVNQLICPHLVWHWISVYQGGKGYVNMLCCDECGKWKLEEE